MNKTIITTLVLCINCLFGSTLAVADNAMADRGRYLITISGCNDCHTPGYLMNDGAVPQSQWLIGDSFGWNGPWGTTYAPNLRLFIKNKTQTEWVKEAKTLRRKPPMPWFNLNAMSEPDLAAIYQFIKSLGAAGKQVPTALPPGKEPPMPYAKFPPPPPKT